ncbi:hypothetical protein A3J90_03155 [candidate division WOR-1 bacterium RIFOXYC2_FULL_37_10]|uniref:Uncharacterized protein n=1 Tax=candidate division WOR-1 bacterium RIFOXYB2_FULL_37_13 TaxID=1802579 RepID=A0A1F4SDW0_UNCSA|nr:MAG: hypothetical protein A2310_03525 [candidate division WOR-1 bacterium RIFOXYB2_FULL_37_13]OGC36831.1 MAG: hypothetical protein A3J90_03155 [candidate division WOR-1 bacterium RIFOXYC2_FULL_37_10]
MWLKITQITNFSHVFKGLSLILLGIFALLFVYYMKQRWQEPKSFKLILFVIIACFIIIYGFFILVFNPNWWMLPY